MPLSFKPVIRYSAQQCAFENMGIPEWLHPDDFSIRKPNSRFSKTALRVGSFSRLE